MTIDSRQMTTKANSIEESHGYNYNNLYAPSTVNFNDIYTNALLLSEEPTLTTAKEEDFHLSGMPSQFVEFHSEKSVDIVSPPPPKYIINSTYLKKIRSTLTEESRTIAPVLTVSSTEEYNDNTVKVIPIKLKTKDYQRGVLDLLFPPARVRTFKNVFDSFRRILSYTFR
ncbi:uncharacterized protein ACR2FA_012799 [Aphomia sociella]